ncbi:post-GPI attachment to proteins factor 3 [Diorhabda sublineata]|uniref:post-GPI attachment to proteins factor 3 n=1 Tax=Diorhabda sublineata TaxID=1163346 RepID=UPI0024E19743|nr:post-GPI attachment to proteins factor 3 [Diorhabda sublineata]
MKLVITLNIIITMLINNVYCSAGDNSPYYQRCVENCELLNCTRDGKEFRENNQPLINKYTFWNCHHECEHECMWKTVEAFHERNWRTPQFYGKWPFIRVLGMQEPASVIFSLLNAFVHVKMIKKFRREVRSDSPLIWLWHAFFIVSVHAWTWSAIFHYRDFLLTEILDYACAFSMILMNCYVMTMRLLYDKLPVYILSGITLIFLLFLVSHIGYLSLGHIDYGYNIELNIAVGTFTALCWFTWCIYNRSNQRYVWKCAMYLALSGLVLLLELIDSPPILYIFDYHSLWHLSTAPLNIFIYSFAIDDCKYLRNEMGEIPKKIP